MSNDTQDWASAEDLCLEQENAPPAQKKYKRKHLTITPDVTIELMERLPRIKELREELDSSVVTDDLVQADQKNQQIIQELHVFAQLPVCMSCLVAAPSTRARAHALENWKYRQHKLICMHCGSRAGPYDGSAVCFTQVHGSLRRRVRSELQMAISFVRTSHPKAMEIKLSKALSDLDIKCGRGRGRRPSRVSHGPEGKVVKNGSHNDLCGLVLQIQRTLDRLLPEPNLRSERAALILGLQLLSEIRS